MRRRVWASASQRASLTWHHDARGRGEAGEASQQWGLVPSWSKAAEGERPTVRAINARDDSVKEGRSIFAAAAQRRRCVVLADGYPGLDLAPWRATVVADVARKTPSRRRRPGTQVL